MNEVALREILPEFHQWSRFSEEKGIDFNGTVVIAGGQRVVIDPPAAAAAVEAALRDLGPITAYLITNRHHVRATAMLRRRFPAPVHVPAADADHIDLPFDATFADGDLLPGGLRAVAVPDGKSPGETALWNDRHGGVLILGDALIGKPSGLLRFLPPDKFADFDRARAGARLLLAHPFDAVLVGDGVSIPSGGRAALERAVAGE